jgi:hypothetical protein
MLNFEKKIHALCDKKINILTLVLSKKNFWTKQKTITPPLQVKWSVPNNIGQVQSGYHHLIEMLLVPAMI